MSHKNILLLFLFGTCSFTTGSVKRFRNISETALSFPALSNNSMDIAQGDLDGDGDMDLVIAMEFRPNVILLNDGKGKFLDVSKERLPQKNHDSEDIALGDFDGDGDLDIIFVSEDDMVNEYYINDGKGYFSDAGSRFPVDGVTNAVLAADLDGDGDLDLIMGNEGQDLFLANDGKGNFTDETGKRMPVDATITQDVEAVDLDGDGDLDLVFGNEDSNRIYMNDGKGNFTDETALRLPSANGTEETRKVEVADINGDGAPDLFFANVRFRPGKKLSNRLLLNNKKGFFTDVTDLNYSGKNDLHSADGQFVDLNGDGAPDLVVANVFGGHQQVFLNDGSGKMKEATSAYFPENLTTEAISVELLDFNADGLPDLYFGVFRGRDILLMGER